MTSLRSVEVSPFRIANARILMVSAASGPSRCAPRIWPVCSSIKVLNPEYRSATRREEPARRVLLVHVKCETTVPSGTLLQPDRSELGDREHHSGYSVIIWFALIPLEQVVCCDL